MTPAIITLKKAKIAFTIHEYHHEPSCDSYGLEAAEKLGLQLEQVFKTLVVQLDGKQLAVAIIPVDAKLSMKLIAKAAKAKKAAMANADDVQRSTGYKLGGVSPIAQKKRLMTFIDISAESLKQMYVSGGQRGLDIELAPDQLQRVTKAQFAPLTS
ncbi:Cys-tRNA(Pro) deacylase [Shewanella eurypsychrophilus]|uniref:Cys-tRNA(Pro)/Cys-tRNA(Cys) deacylase n=1 Tax=Shewanella eurypsychrophilus TaxID=2593656 RepID=A0ABX6V098_9GAMM|nr:MULTISPECIES: Cys-tRNA(Pro) deacylase [Shewanella]QFU20431.1 Cys-tRNA(Pro) deacylase [Shewanella sp. YLB-09]QPG56008.1 Cys-tRNA(Pro) deacylase [Shewanella eurypsychrophilus]